MPQKIKKFDYSTLALGNDEVSLRLERENAGFFWDGHIKQYYDKYVTKESDVLEVGANIGTHTVYLSKLAKKVIAFEPQTFIYYNLCANLFLNDCLNVEAHNAACFYKACRLFINDGVPDYLKKNMAASKGFSITPNDSQSVQAIKIDDLQLANLNFIKVDTEGCDLLVLCGALETIKKFRPVIICEIHDALIGQFKCSLQDHWDVFNKIEYNYTNIGYGDWLLMPK